MTDSTTSSKRAEANRRNSRKSTGPRTQEGKDRSRFNALKHGMRAHTLVLPGEDHDAFDHRLDRWTADLQPRDDVERFLVRRAVQLSWQLERADRALAARSADARRDADDRLAACAEEVAGLGRRLLRDPRGPLALYPHWHDARGRATPVSWSAAADDPDDPARLVIRLEASALGCAWMLDRWAELRAVLEQGLLWQAPDRFKAIRLLGRQPIDAWEDRRVESIYLGCGAMEPGEQAFQDLDGELQDWEWTRFIERLNGRAAGSRQLADAGSGEAVLLGVIAEEEARLEGLLAGLLEREEAAEGFGRFDPSAEGERVRRYQATCDRMLLRVLEALRRRGKEAGGSERAPRQAAERPNEGPPDEATTLPADLLRALMEPDAAMATNEANAPACRGPSTPLVAWASPTDAGPANAIEAGPAILHEPGPVAPLRNGPTDPGAGIPSRAEGELSPAESSRAPSADSSPPRQSLDVTGPIRPGEPRIATNEANRPTEEPGGSRSGPFSAMAPVLAMLMALLWTAVSARAVVGATGPARINAMARTLPGGMSTSSRARIPAPEHPHLFVGMPPDR